MAYEIPGFTRSYEAAGDLSTSYLKFVKMAGATITAVTTAATDDAIGVLQNKPNAAGVSGTVMVSGVTRVKAASAIAAGVAVYLTADGRVDDVLVAGACVGITETAAAAADDVVALLLRPLGAVGA